MSNVVPMPGVMYNLNTTTRKWEAPGRVSLPAEVNNPDAIYRPVSYSGWSDDVRVDLGLPTGNYVVWSYGDQMLEQVFSSLPADAILVLPQRYNPDGTVKPYLIDSSNGFMAAGVTGVDGTGAGGLKDGSIDPIVSNPRLWFEMCRARRGVVGLGPDAVIQPSQSSWTQGPQPVLQDEPAGQQFQRAYFSSGGTMNLSGAQNGMMGFDHANPVFANFTIRGRSFGGVSYSTIKRTGGTGQHFICKRVNFDGSWRGHEGVPNGETGCIALSGGTYLIENCDLMNTANGAGTSPIMWNNTTGGTVRNVRGGSSSFGMWTFWRSGGVNTFENVHIIGGHPTRTSTVSGMNLEEILAGFTLNWTGGSFILQGTANKFHFGINPVGGPPRINLVDLQISTNAWTPGAMTANVYTTHGVAKRSYITCNTLPVSCVPAVAWID